jgi:hypothetical protein
MNQSTNDPKKQTFPIISSNNDFENPALLEKSHPIAMKRTVMNRRDWMTTPCNSSY